MAQDKERSPFMAHAKICVEVARGLPINVEK